MKMDQNFAPPPVEVPQKKSKSGLIIAIVVIVVLCICCAFAGLVYYLWENGDELFNITANFLPMIL